MSRQGVRRLAIVGFGLFLLSGSIHLLLGLGSLANPQILGVETLVLPMSFIMAGLAVFVVAGVYKADMLPNRTTYVLASFLMAIYVVAYIDWHVFQFVASIEPFEAVGLEHDHSHGHDSHHEHEDESSAGMIFIDHLRDDFIALVTKTAEGIAAVILAILAVLERD